MYHWIVFGKGILAFLLLVHLLYERKVITSHDTANPPKGKIQEFLASAVSDKKKTQPNYLGYFERMRTTFFELG